MTDLLRRDSPEQLFDAAYLAYRADIERRCAAILRDAAEAEDATDETFARAWRALLAGELHGDLRPWLRVVARNVCYDICRSRKHASSVDTTTLDAIGPSSDSSDCDLLEDFDASLVRESVRRMPPSYQSILTLREDLELSYKEIAAHEEIPVAAVESRLYRARCALRREYLALLGPEGAAALVWLHLRGHLMSLQPFVTSVVSQAGETVQPDATSSFVAPAAGIGGVIAATAVAALTTVGVVHITSTPVQAPPKTTVAPAAAAPASSDSAHPSRPEASTSRPGERARRSAPSGDAAHDDAVPAIATTSANAAVRGLDPTTPTHASLATSISSPATSSVSLSGGSSTATSPSQRAPAAGSATGPIVTTVAPRQASATPGTANAPAATFGFERWVPPSASSTSSTSSTPSTASAASPSVPATPATAGAAVGAAASSTAIVTVTTFWRPPSASATQTEPAVVASEPPAANDGRSATTADPSTPAPSSETWSSQRW